jgi:hypothetical protein
LKKQHYKNIKEQRMMLSKVLTDEISKAFNMNGLSNPPKAELWSVKNFENINSGSRHNGNLSQNVLFPMLYHILGFTEMLSVRLVGPLDATALPVCQKAIGDFINGSTFTQYFTKPLLVSIIVPNILGKNGVQMPDSFDDYNLESCLFATDIDIDDYGNRVGGHALSGVKCDDKYYILNSHGRQGRTIEDWRVFDNTKEEYNILYVLDWRPFVKNAMPLLKSLDKSQYLQTLGLTSGIEVVQQEGLNAFIGGKPKKAKTAKSTKSTKVKNTKSKANPK